MDRLETKPCEPRDCRDQAAAQEEIGDERADDQAAKLRRCVSLKGHGGAQPDDLGAWRDAFELVERSLVHRLVASKEGGFGAERPVLADQVISRCGRVGADRRGVDQLWHPHRCHRVEYPAASIDVEPFELFQVMRGLDRVGEVDDDIGAIKGLLEVGADNAGVYPARLVGAPVGTGGGAGEANDLAYLVTIGEGFDDAAADVAGGPGHHHFHGRLSLHLLLFMLSRCPAPKLAKRSAFFDECA